MTALGDGGPAFPRAETIVQNSGGVIDSHFAGMSLRDYFAGHALVALVSSPRSWSKGSPVASQPYLVRTTTSYAQLAYAIADEMLAARQNGGAA